MAKEELLIILMRGEITVKEDKIKCAKKLVIAEEDLLTMRPSFPKDQSQLLREVLSELRIIHERYLENLTPYAREDIDLLGR